MPISSPIPSVKVPNVDIATLFFEQARARVDAAIAAGSPREAESPLLVDGITGRSPCFSDIRQQSLNIGRALTQRGFCGQLERQTVVVFAPSDISFCCIYYGTLMAGGVYVPLGPELGAAELARRLAEVDATVVIVAAELMSTLLAACKLADLDIGQANVILLSGSYPGHATLSSICEESGASPSFEPIVITDSVELKNRVAMVLYTSGTTGDSKGVLLTHRNLVHMYAMVGGYSAQTVRDTISTTAQSRVLSALPTSSIYGHSVLCYQPLAGGDCVVQLPTFDVATYLETIERYQIERLSGTPTLFHSLLCHTTKVNKGLVALAHAPERKFDIRSVKTVGCGGAPLPNCRRQQYSEYFGGIPVITGYGQTESSSIIAGSS
ncbi:hypothetical protein IWW38_005482, partial [Coemansia aciculifera]